MKLIIIRREETMFVINNVFTYGNGYNIYLFKNNGHFSSLKTKNYCIVNAFIIIFWKILYIVRRCKNHFT